MSAKKEMSYHINENTIENIKVVKGTATDLSWIPKESVDYIYTDPPYGKKNPISRSFNNVECLVRP